MTGPVDLALDLDRNCARLRSRTSSAFKLGSENTFPLHTCYATKCFVIADPRAHVGSGVVVELCQVGWVSHHAQSHLAVGKFHHFPGPVTGDAQQIHSQVKGNSGSGAQGMMGANAQSLASILCSLYTINPASAACRLYTPSHQSWEGGMWMRSSLMAAII